MIALLDGLTTGCSGRRYAPPLNRNIRPHRSNSAPRPENMTLFFMTAP